MSAETVGASDTAVQRCAGDSKVSCCACREARNMGDGNTLYCKVFDITRSVEVKLYCTAFRTVVTLP